MYDFSKALTNNIERTYTYAYASNAFQYPKPAYEYNALEFFHRLLEIEPFKAFMNLERYGFKQTKRALDRYEIPYTADQERRARVFYDVTTLMLARSSDYVSLDLGTEDLEGTGVVLYKAPNTYTTYDTLAVAKFIRNLPAHQKVNNTIYTAELPDLLKRSNEQMEALETCVTHKVSCLIGGAGTGKSFVTANIINQLKENDQRVVVLAPTHKAKEALQEKLEDNVTVRTIHSYIYKPEDCDAIVIDESGMLSTPLFKGLINNYKNQQLVFVGDKNQLPPIEYGRPFELLQQSVTVSELKENRRSEAADIIALGKEVIGIPQNANMNTPNIVFAPTIQSAFEDEGAEVLLTFTNADVKETNEQQKLKDAPASIYPEFSIGDKIIAKTNKKGKHFNGELFTIIDYDLIESKTTGRKVRLNTPQDLAYNFDLAYGLTIHKSQGSEWDVVAYKPSDLDTRNLAYVAITRAKKKLVIIGDLKSEYLAQDDWRFISWS